MLLRCGDDIGLSRPWICYSDNNPFMRLLGGIGARRGGGVISKAKAGVIHLKIEEGAISQEIQMTTGS
jgi:hypothetical protein